MLINVTTAFTGRLLGLFVLIGLLLTPHCLTAFANPASPDPVIAKEKTEAQMAIKSNESSASNLHIAVSEANAEMLESLIQAGMDVETEDNYGRTPLHLAASKGFTQGVTLLLAAGAKVNTVDVDSSTPLHNAAYFNYVDIVKQLIQASADVNLRDGLGCTPLHWAVWGGFGTETITMLLNAGADVNSKSYEGETAFKRASEEGKTDIIKVLKKAGGKK